MGDTILSIFSPLISTVTNINSEIGSEALGFADMTMSLIGCVFYLLFVIIGLVYFIFWLIMLIDVIKREKNEFPSGSGDDPKTLWILILLLGQMVGLIIYYFLIYTKIKRSKK